MESQILYWKSIWSSSGFTTNHRSERSKPRYEGFFPIVSRTEFVSECVFGNSIVFFRVFSLRSIRQFKVKIITVITPHIFKIVWISKKESKSIKLYSPLVLLVWFFNGCSKISLFQSYLFLNWLFQIFKHRKSNSSTFRHFRPMFSFQRKVFLQFSLWPKFKQKSTVKTWTCFCFPVVSTEK